MLRATFQLVRNLGPERERRLWHAGLTDWTDLSRFLVEAQPATRPSLVPRSLAPGLGWALAAADRALDASAIEPLARALPRREHWRLYGPFADRAVFLDIETDVLEGITAIGLLDQHGPRILLAGRDDLDRFPTLVPPHALLVTFNGGSFDLPWLRRRFPTWQVPSAHIDLRPLWGRLGLTGGLKQIEERAGLGRPDHLRGLDGSRAAWLWRHGQHGSRQALRQFVEYNLYDAVNLRPLLDLAYNQLTAAAGFAGNPVPVSYRGDVLYDVSKILLSL